MGRLKADIYKHFGLIELSTRSNLDTLLTGAYVVLYVWISALHWQSFVLAMILYLEVRRNEIDQSKIVGNSRLLKILDQDALPYVQWYIQFSV